MNDQRYVMLAVTLLLLLVAVQVSADESLSSRSAVRPEPASETLDSPDIIVRHTLVFRDPVTGRIGVGPASGIPVRSLSPREQNMLSRSDEGLQATVLANGAVAVNLRGRFQSMATASPNSGTSQLHMSCSIGDGTHSSDKLAPETR